jgi:trigger factor
MLVPRSGRCQVPVAVVPGSGDPVKTTVERVDDTTVKLSVTVEAERVGQAVDAAARRLAGEVKVPGFRPGRVPRRVLETRLGKQTLVQEAMRDALPQFYTEAVQAEQLAVVGPPEFDVETFDEGAEGVFSATVEVRPEIEVPDYAGLQVPHPEWELTDEEIQQQLDSLRERFAQLETVERPAQVGDYVLITVTGTRDGQRVEEASGEDLLYRVSDPAESDSELDRHVVGSEAGAVLTFTDTLGEDYAEELAGLEVEFTALVKEVKSLVLPELDDDFALTASEYDTMDELRAGLTEQMAQVKRRQARQALRGKVVEAVSDLVDVPLPKAMVAEEVRFRLYQLSSQAEQHGLTLDQYLEATGMDSQQLLAQLEEDGGRTVKAQLVIDAIGRAADIDVDREDLGTEIAYQAARLGRAPDEIAQLMTHPDRIQALVSDAYRRKAIDHLVASVEVLAGPPDEPDEVVGDEPVGSTAAAALAAAEAAAEAAEGAEGAEADGEA